MVRAEVVAATEVAIIMGWGQIRAMQAAPLHLMAGVVAVEQAVGVEFPLVEGVAVEVAKDFRELAVTAEAAEIPGLTQPIMD